MSYLDIETETKERNILKALFKEILSSQPIDSSISDSKIMRSTANKLKAVFRGSTQRCSCAKRTWGGMCEVCQASDGELCALRYFYRVMKKAKKRGMSADDLKQFIENELIKTKC